MPRLRCPEEANLKAPEAVIGVHAGFIRAGAELIETNTFGANRRKLSAQFLDDRLEEIVEQGVKLAREAREVAGVPVLIGGAIGPLGDLEGSTGAEDAYAVFHEQARLLEGRGVDVFLVETFYDLDELETAIRPFRPSPRSRSSRSSPSTRTVRRSRASTRAKRSSGSTRSASSRPGRTAGSGPQAALAALGEMRAGANGLPLTAQPNVGLPSRSGGRIVYPHATPDYFAEFAAQARSQGARLIGGCCGTTPAQIAAIRAAVEEGREPRVPLFVIEREVVAGPAPAPGRTLLQERLEAGEWVVSVELDPPKGTNMEAMLGVAARLRASGAVHVVDINDNPMARARLSALMAAVVLERVGRDRDDPARHAARRIRHGPPVPAPRRARRGRAQRPRRHRRPAARRRLPGLERRLRRRRDRARLAPRPPQPRRGLLRQGDRRADVVLRRASPSTRPSDDLDRELERFRQKVEAGARFAMTQALFDLGYLDRFLDRLGGESPIPLLVGVWPLTSYQLAFRLHNEVPGITIPDAVQERLADAGADARAVGFELARQLVEERAVAGRRNLRHPAVQGAERGP